MILDSNKYRLNIPHIKLMIDKKSEKDTLEMIGAIAVATGVPIIVVEHYIGELIGFSPELLAMMDRHKKFYQVTEVL